MAASRSSFVLPLEDMTFDRFCCVNVPHLPFKGDNYWLTRKISTASTGPQHFSYGQLCGSARRHEGALACGLRGEPASRAGTGMRARGGLSEKLTLGIAFALWQTIENAQHFLVGATAATFFFLLNIPDLVCIDWDKPAFDIYDPKSRLIAVSVRSSSVRSVTLWYNFVTPRV